MAVAQLVNLFESLDQHTPHHRHHRAMMMKRSQQQRHQRSSSPSPSRIRLTLQTIFHPHHGHSNSYSYGQNNTANGQSKVLSNAPVAAIPTLTSTTTAMTTNSTTSPSTSPSSSYRGYSPSPQCRRRPEISNILFAHPPSPSSSSSPLSLADLLSRRYPSNTELDIAKEVEEPILGSGLGLAGFDLFEPRPLPLPPNAIHALHTHTNTTTTNTGMMEEEELMIMGNKRSSWIEYVHESLHTPVVLDGIFEVMERS